MRENHPMPALADAGQGEQELRDQWTAPLPRECLTCYVGRMLADFGCDDTMRWVTRWRAACAPRATRLMETFAARGAKCDCQLASRVYPEQLLLPEGTPPRPCAGVSRLGSTKPCRPVADTS